MKILLLSLFVAAAFAAPAPLDEETGEPVELIVNGIAEGEPLEIGDVLGIKVKQHVDGQIMSATDLLHPLTAAGLEEAAVADRPQPIEVDEDPEVVDTDPVEPLPPILPEVLPPDVPVEVPDYVVLPPPSIPELVPEPIELPEPVFPEIKPPVFPEIEPPTLPEINPPDVGLPEVNPPDVGLPEVNPPDVGLPELGPPGEAVPELPPQFPNGEVFNNGVVQVTLNAPEPGYLASIQSWFSMVLNYFNGSYVTTHQIV